MRYLYSVVALLVVSWLAWPQQNQSGGSTYLLAASPVVYGADTYPADLFTPSEGGKLKLVRHIAPADQGVAFVLSASNALVVAHKAIDPTVFEIVHFDHPQAADSITLSAGDRSVVSGLVMETPTQGSMLALHVVSPPEHIPNRADLVGIELRQSTSEQRVLDPLPWHNLVYARPDGRHGGPFEGFHNLDLAGFLTPDGLVSSSASGSIALLPYSSWQSGYRGGLATIICANGRFSVISVTARATAKGAASSPILIVYDRQSGDTRQIAIPGERSRLRLFGSWLAVVVGESATDHAVNPGSERQRQTATATRPSVAAAYEFLLRRQGEWLPGILELIDLETGAIVEEKTGQSDSEILGVTDGKMLYRVNQQILEASVENGHFGQSTVMVDDEGVSEIHWAFRGAK